MTITDVDVKATKDPKVYSVTVITDQVITVNALGDDELYTQHLFWNSESDITLIGDQVAAKYADEIAEKARLAALKATILLGLK